MIVFVPAGCPGWPWNLGVTAFHFPGFAKFCLDFGSFFVLARWIGPRHSSKLPVVASACSRNQVPGVGSTSCRAGQIEPAGGSNLLRPASRGLAALQSGALSNRWVDPSALRAAGWLSARQSDDSCRQALPGPNRRRRDWFSPAVTRVVPSYSARQFQKHRWGTGVAMTKGLSQSKVSQQLEPGPVVLLTMASNGWAEHPQVPKR